MPQNRSLCSYKLFSSAFPESYLQYRISADNPCLFSKINFELSSFLIFFLFFCCHNTSFHFDELDFVTPDQFFQKSKVQITQLIITNVLKEGQYSAVQAFSQVLIQGPIKSALITKEGIVYMTGVDQFEVAFKSIVLNTIPCKRFHLVECSCTVSWYLFLSHSLLFL